MSAVALADSYSLVALDIWALAVATACSIFFCAWSALDAELGRLPLVFVFLLHLELELGTLVLELGLGDGRSLGRSRLLGLEPFLHELPVLIELVLRLFEVFLLEPDLALSAWWSRP